MELSKPRGRGKTMLALRLLAAGVMLAFLCGALATGALAQSNGGPSITSMTLQVWPEYDDSRVLVMMQGSFADKAALPDGKATFLIPKGAEINSTCSLDPQDNHLSQLWTPTDSPDGKFIQATFPMPEQKFHVEYYHDLVNKDSLNKSIAYTFTAPYPIESLSVQIQQPLKATDFNITPAPAAMGNAPDFNGKSFTVATYTYSKLTRGQSLDFNIKYTKSDPAPSTTRTTGQQSASSSTGGALTSDYTMLLAGIVGLGVVGAAVYYVYSRRSRPTLTPRTATAAHGRGGSYRSNPSAKTNVARKNQVRATGTRPSQQQPKSAGSAFCTSCGAEVRRTDAFCPACGKKTKARA